MNKLKTLLPNLLFVLLFLLSSSVFSQMQFDVQTVNKLQKSYNEADSSDENKVILNKISNKFDFYKKRYKKDNLTDIITGNRGLGNDKLYGTRNMRPVLHGVAYRGGANNYFHKIEKRENTNPLPDDGISNLYREGFSQAVYLNNKNYSSVYPTISEKRFNYIQNSANTKNQIYSLLKITYDNIKSKKKGPIYFHDWNGWFKSGYVSAILLRQFCDFTPEQALNYWKLCAEGGRGHKDIKDSIAFFKAYKEFAISIEEKDKICPCFENNIASITTIVEDNKLSLSNIMELLSVNVNFETNESLLSKKAEEALSKYAAFMLKYDYISLRITGHADSTEKNQEQLSNNRIKVVTDFLTKQNISPNRFTYKSYGATKPTDTNKNASGRKLNRCVELNIKYFDLNTQFKHGQHLLTDESKEKLKVFKEIYNSYSNYDLNLEIGTHTDIQLDAQASEQLTTARAKSVYEYLASIGVDKHRLTYKGYSNTMPKVTSGKNSYDINNRVEFYLSIAKPIIIKPKKIVYDSTRVSSYPRKARVRPSPANSATMVYTIKSGDNLGYIADWYNVTISDVRYWNGIGRNNMIRAGKNLNIYVPKSKRSKYQGINSMSFAQKQRLVGKTVKNTTTTSSSHKTTSSKSTTQNVTKKISTTTLSNEFIYYKVRKGDNPWLIAKKYSGVSSENILKINNMGRNDYLKIGQVIKIKRK